MDLELEQLLAQVVAIPSINSTLVDGQGEEEIARWITAWLRERGLQAERWNAEDGRPNVVARVPGRGAAPPLLLNAHMDTVGVDDMDAPYTLRAEGDRLYGRGAYDMKCSIAIMLSLAERWAKERPSRDVWLTFVSDEEDLSRGMEALVQHWLPSLPEPPAEAIVLEPTEEAIGVAHKGFAWIEIEVEGRAAHGSRYEEGIDAILPLADALSELRTIEEQLMEHQHPLLGRPSLHASVVQGGTAWCVYPAHATLRWERRTLPDEELGRVELELNRVLVAARSRTSARVQGHIAFTRYPLQTPVDAGLVQALRGLLPESEVTGLAFWTDGALLSDAGIPTVIFGPTGAGAHTPHEWVSAISLYRVRSVLETLCR